jgi:hypothetical protein
MRKRRLKSINGREKESERKKKEKWSAYVFANASRILIPLNWLTRFFSYTRTDKANLEHIEYIDLKNETSIDLRFVSKYWTSIQSIKWFNWWVRSTGIINYINGDVLERLLFFFSFISIEFLGQKCKNKKNISFMLT